jgi:hypothetical protein
MRVGVRNGGGSGSGTMDGIAGLPPAMRETETAGLPPAMRETETAGLPPAMRETAGLPPAMRERRTGLCHP